MAEPTLRERILEILTGRLQAVQIAKGFNTDAGLSVHHGPLVVSDGVVELPLLCLIPGDEQLVSAPATGLNRHTLRWPIAVQGLVKADPENPLAATEPLIADLKRALFDATARNLGGLVEDIEYGGATAGVDRDSGGSHALVQVVALVKFTETYGAPERV